MFVVRYRTFLRTYLHELCHHIDFEKLHLIDAFHTAGFFKRESSLMRQIGPRPPKKEKTPPRRSPPHPSSRSRDPTSNSPCSTGRRTLKGVIRT